MRGSGVFSGSRAHRDITAAWLSGLHAVKVAPLREHGGAEPCANRNAATAPNGAHPAQYGIASLATDRVGFEPTTSL